MKNTVDKIIGVARESKTIFVAQVYLCPTTNMLPAAKAEFSWSRGLQFTATIVLARHLIF